MNKEDLDDIRAILDVLPPAVCKGVQQYGRTADLLEIVLDLGRRPMGRYVDGEIELSEIDISRVDIDLVAERIGEFDGDNRAGIERTLHRISGIRNRRGALVGLTCRVGRAVYGTIEIVEDLVMSGAGILLLGRPGIGKTTMLREAARVLAAKRRVVIVDTSNEIGGDGDIPHPAVGRARRMQVKNTALQHEVMIEAVENHNPETIVIDEIGREQEAAAARTIAERGVQLIATAHGNTLDNILINPTLSDLVGGVESVTLSDEEARRRRSQKTVLERRSAPTFQVLVEIVERERLNIHTDLGRAVDLHLRGRQCNPEFRFRDGLGGIERQVAPVGSAVPQQGWRNKFGKAMPGSGLGQSPSIAVSDARRAPPTRVYAYGITEQRLKMVAGRLGVPLRLVSGFDMAQVFVTHKSHYRRNERPISDAEALGIPVYVLRSGSVHQIESFLVELFGGYIGDFDSEELKLAISDVDSAIQDVLSGTNRVELAPQPSLIRREQHRRVRQAKLVSHSYGKKRNRRVRVLRE